MTDKGMIIFCCILFSFPFLWFPLADFISKILYMRKHKNFIDDGKPIQNKILMESECYAIHKMSPLYATLECGICCPYKEECEKYELRYKRYPNGDVDYRRKKNDGNKGDKND